MTLDDAGVDRKLDEFGAHAQQATGKAFTAMERLKAETSRAGEALDKSRSSLQGVNTEVATLIKTQMAIGAVKGIASAVGDEWRRVADDIGKASREWQQFRQSLSGVASLSKQQNTNAFAKAEVDRAERARVTPQEAKEFRKEFLAKASLYVGEGQDSRLGTADADEVQTKLMEFAKDKEVSQKDMAGFVGGLLAQTKGKTNAKDLLARAGKVFGGLEESSVDVSHLLPMTTMAMAQGFSPEESAQTLAMMPEIAPGQEGTYMLRAVEALRTRVQKGEGEEFGLKKGMKPYEILTTAVQNIKDRAAKGEDVEDLIKEATHGERVSGKALRGMIDQGPEAFARWRRVVEDIPEDQVQRIIESERTTESGLQRAVDSRKAVEQARMGLRGDTVERRRQIAETELTAGGQFEHVQYGQLPAAIIPGADDMKTRQINLQAIRRARADLHESSGLGDAFASLNKGTTNELLQTLINRIEKQTEEIKKQGGDHGPPPPMPAAPAHQPARVR